MKKLQDMVIEILENFPDTRNSDITLTISIWKMWFRNFLMVDDTSGMWVRLDDLYILPREDNIKRIRAKLNAEGKYWPTELKVALHRRINEDDWRKFMGYPVAQREDYTPPQSTPTTDRKPQSGQAVFGLDIKSEPKTKRDELYFLKPNGRRK